MSNLGDELKKDAEGDPKLKEDVEKEAEQGAEAEGKKLEGDIKK
ncbi:MAG: hypothetical protein JWM85_74 [Acidimicrobiaceae bacterium]|nr:hypothetical protein [Acidimicrobiaceae bacterium]